MNKSHQKLKFSLLIPLILISLSCLFVFLTQVKTIFHPNSDTQIDSSSQIAAEESLKTPLTSKNPPSDDSSNAASETESEESQTPDSLTSRSKTSQNTHQATTSQSNSTPTPAVQTVQDELKAKLAAKKAQAAAEAKAKAEAEAQAQALQTAVQDLDAYIASRGYHVSVAYLNLTTQFSYQYNPSEVYYGASLVKTLDALYVYEHPDLLPNLKPYVKSAIEVSDNAAHLSLVNAIGLDNLRSFAQSLGTSQAGSLTSDDCYGNTTVGDQLLVLSHLYNFITNPALDPSLRSELKNYFINDYYNYVSFPGSPTIMHKYGSLYPNFHEAAIVLDDRPYLLVILSQEPTNARAIFSDLSSRLFELHKLT